MDTHPRAEDLEDDGVEHADVEHPGAAECWNLLRSARIGRVAVVRDGSPDVFPVNHVVDHGTIVYRTSAGELFTAALNHQVAFEADGLHIDGSDQDTAQAWSVVLRGRASEGHRIDQLLDTLNLPVAPWQPGAKPRFIRIEPREITGRRFRVVDPDLRNTPK